MFNDITLHQLDALSAGAREQCSPYCLEITSSKPNDVTAIKIGCAIWVRGAAYAPISIKAALVNHGHHVC